MSEKFDQWAIVELMGHQMVAGKVTEEEHFGVNLCRVDVPLPDGSFATCYYGGSAIYAVKPTDEQTARDKALRSGAAPVQRWEIVEMARKMSEEKPAVGLSQNDARGLGR